MKYNQVFTVSLIALTLAGCYQNRPEMTNMREALQSKMERRVVDKPIYLAKPEKRASGSLWQKGSNSFFKDSRAKAVGDILTVIVNEKADGEIEATTEADRTHNSTANLLNLLNVEGLLESRFLSDTPTGNLTNSNSTRSFDGEATTEREDKLTARIAAVVTEVLPNGYLVIQGQREVVVNYELQELRIEGIVRPQDVGADNTVPSEKIAEARISYAGRGIVDESQEPQPIVRWVDKWLPL